MFDRIGQTLTLGRACWKVLLLDKEMLVFPLLSTIVLAVIFGGTFFPLWESGQLEFWVQAIEADPNLEQHPDILAMLFATYFITALVVVFFNAGLLTCAMIRFAGGDPTVMDGLSASVQRLPQILAWAFVTAIIGVALEVLESRLEGLSRFFVNMLGAGWAVATFFAVPVLVVEGVGPVAAIRHSASAVRKTWGKALTGHIGLEIFHIIAGLAAVPFLLVAILLFGRDPVPAMVIAALVVIWWVLCSLVITTLSAILRAGLYIYAVEGKMPVHFDSKLISSAFDVR